MQRRRILLAGIAMMTAVGLAGCATGGAGGESAELSDEPVTISLNWWGGDARTQATKEAVALFEAAYPNVTVETSFSDWNGYWDRLATSTAANDMPDVNQFDQLYLASYADRGTLLDLSEVGAQLDTSVIDESILQSGVVDDTQYALPISGTPNGVLINKTLLEKYGIPIPDFDIWTWDDLTEIAQTVSDESGGAEWGINPLALGIDSFAVNVWARQHGEDFYDKEGDLVVSPETIASAWEQGLSWIDSGAAPTADHIAENTANTLDQTDFALGRVAMIFAGVSQLASYQAAAPTQELIVGNWPTDSETVEGFQYFKPVQYWTVSSRSEHPAEAAALISFLTSDPEVAKLFGTDRGVPANPTARDTIESSLDPAGMLTLEFTTAMAEQVKNPPAITPNGASTVDATLARYYQQVLFGQVEPVDAAEQFIKEIQASIDAAK
ncbi:ABC transporter substrate-binding protein [Microbacterium invictum]|uniref:Multiple sugar transport system substrate-binding protein n=1 Tax=Microbacterium invictum TaxID=515415 RepID=A0AA40SR84_9MICO|nr:MULTISPECIES: sugar ABC transporter substrate-binding protein [Microbacterium]MBB4140816.1 multiple sugar transport system substrate-binding protein [Microbacterium invictum]